MVKWLSIDIFFNLNYRSGVLIAISLLHHVIHGTYTFPNKQTFMWHDKSHFLNNTSVHKGRYLAVFED